MVVVVVVVVGVAAGVRGVQGFRMLLNLHSKAGLDDGPDSSLTSSTRPVGAEARIPLH